jgi:hypothetical protein
VVAVGDTAYVYGDAAWGETVARVPLESFATGPWQYYAAPGWTSAPSGAGPLPMDRPPRASMSVIPYKGGFLASAKMHDVTSADVSAWWAPAPTGPFASWGTVASTAASTPPGWITYSGRIDDIPGAGLIVVWSQNAADTTGMDLTQYGPVFATPSNPHLASG